MLDSDEKRTERRRGYAPPSRRITSSSLARSLLAARSDASSSSPTVFFRNASATSSPRASRVSRIAASTSSPRTRSASRICLTAESESSESSSFVASKGASLSSSEPPTRAGARARGFGDASAASAARRFRSTASILRRRSAVRDSAAKARSSAEIKAVSSETTASYPVEVVPATTTGPLRSGDDGAFFSAPTLTRFFTRDSSASTRLASGSSANALDAASDAACLDASCESWFCLSSSFFRVSFQSRAQRKQTSTTMAARAVAAADESRFNDVAIFGSHSNGNGSVLLFGKASPHAWHITAARRRLNSSLSQHSQQCATRRSEGRSVGSFTSFETIPRKPPRAEETSFARRSVTMACGARVGRLPTRCGHRMTEPSRASVSRTKSGWVSKNHQLSPRRDNVPWLPSRSRSYTRAPDASSGAAITRGSLGANETTPDIAEGSCPRTLAASAATSAFARASLSRDRGDRASASSGRASLGPDDDVDGTSGGDGAPRGRDARSSSPDIAAETPERDARSAARTASLPP